MYEYFKNLPKKLYGKELPDTLEEMEPLFAAVAGLRESGDQDILPLALFARAFCYRIQNQFPQAWDDLEEAREIAERGSMKLWLVDYHLEAVRLRIAEFGFRNADKPQELNRDEMLAQIKTDMEQADQLVKETGYHRRDPEVELGYAGLFFAQGDQTKAQEHLAKAKQMLDKMGIRE